MQQYLDEWNYLVAESYSAPLPDELRAACAEKGNAGVLVERSLPGAGTTTFAAAAQSVCGANSLCVVPSGATLRMDGSPPLPHRGPTTPIPNLHIDRKPAPDPTPERPELTPTPHPNS